jgi:4-diphosphocytidyl-2-C-methyl-D-erythritol kinase
MAIVLANPGTAVSTAEIFAGVRARRGVEGAKPAGWASSRELISYLETTTNDLEAPARAIAPVIGDVLGGLAHCRDALLARMSGSGATCFGLFDSDVAAAAAAKQISVGHPSWWVAPARLI